MPATIENAPAAPGAARPGTAAAARLPPLDALRVFEATARHLSFTRAADEAQVTQAAVSHRVRELEAQLRTRLFRRLTRRVELTEDGQVLAAAVRRGLDAIAEGLAEIDQAAGTGAAAAGPLRVSVLPSLAQRWLVPRLRRFHARCPRVEVRVSADARHADLHAGAADLAVRFGRGRYPGLRSEFLMGDAVVPVCSPAFRAARGGLFRRLEDLMRGPLLHDSDCGGHASGEDWPSWLAFVGRPDLAREEGQRFSNATLTLGAAAAGLGVALGRRSLVDVDLAAGRLVPAWPAASPTVFSYWLVWRPEAAGASPLAAFRAWLVEEAGAFVAGRGPLAPAEASGRPDGRVEPPGRVAQHEFLDLPR